MTNYDRAAQILGQVAVAILGAQAAGITPEHYFPVWLIAIAWVVNSVAQSTGNAWMRRPTVGEAIEKAKIGGVLLLAAGLALTTGCAHLGPTGGKVVACAGIEVVEVAPAVVRALVVGDWAELARLAKQYGFDVIACAVQQQGVEAKRRAASTGNPKAALADHEVEANAAKWLEDNRVTFK